MRLGCVGVTSTLAMFPLETVRTRLAVDHHKYRNVLMAFRIITAEEGFPALYRVSPPPTVPQRSFSPRAFAFCMVATS
jgi:hypothetical protein